MKRLVIETNHGFVELADVTTEQFPYPDRAGSYLVAVGTVVDSRETSRLFHATSSREVFPKGSKQWYPIYRQPYCTDTAADSWHVSTVTCG